MLSPWVGGAIIGLSAELRPAIRKLLSRGSTKMTGGLAYRFGRRIGGLIYWLRRPRGT
jgi:hypothetical protein